MSERVLRDASASKKASSPKYSRPCPTGNVGVFVSEEHESLCHLLHLESQKRKLDKMAQLQGPDQSVLEQIGMKPGTPKELQHARGDLVEKELF